MRDGMWRLFCCSKLSSSSCRCMHCELYVRAPCHFAVSLHSYLNWMFQYHKLVDWLTSSCSFDSLLWRMRSRLLVRDNWAAICDFTKSSHPNSLAGMRWSALDLRAWDHALLVLANQLHHRVSNMLIHHHFLLISNAFYLK